MSDPDTASTSREDETTLREKDILAIKLLRAIREKKVAEAKKILTENPNIHYRDKTGCQGLHYAAQEGFLDLVKTLIEEGAHVNCFDQNGQSPLHKASSRGHVDVVIHLVANGAQVGSLDWNNHTPFEKAVISRSVNVVEILLMFGAEPNLQDWSWTMEKLGEKEIKIQELITDHVPLVPGYKYEGIQFEVVCAKPNEDITLEKLRLTLCAIDVRNSFIFFCRKMQSEYTELKSLLHEDQTPYSDMFELRTWGATRKTLSLKVIVEGIPKCNEHLFVVSHDRQVGRVDNFIKNEDENTTEVTLTIKMNTKGPTQFAIASVFKKETFAISEDEVVIKPTAEPEAEIDIPKGTFDKAAELQLNVVDTNDVNEDEEDESGPLLMTNVIDMSMSDGQQPKEEIVMKLPIHKKGNEVEEMCVLATSEEDPDDVDDWEVIEAQTDSKGKAAVFKIKHFSIYAGANKKKVMEDKQAITEAIARSIKKERKVEFRLFTRLEQERGKFQFILECWTPKKLKKGGKSRFENDGCEVIDLPAKLYIVDENQTFKLRFKGNCRKVSSENTTKVKEEGNNDDETNEEQNENENEDAEDNDFVILDFVGKKGYSFTIVDMIVLDTEKPSGKVIIDKEIRTIEMIEQIVSEPSGICKGKGQVVPVENITFHYEDLAEVAFGVKLPPPPKPVREPTDIQMQSLVEEKKLEEFVEKTDAEYPTDNNQEETNHDRNMDNLASYTERVSSTADSVEVKEEEDIMSRISTPEIIDETEEHTEAEKEDESALRTPTPESDEPTEEDIKEREHEVQKLVAMGLNENTELSYSVLNPSSITSLCKCLSMEEAGLFGLQLGLPLSIKDDLINAANPAKELAFRLLGIWSGSKHSSRRVRKIQEALRRISRDDLALAVGAAFENDLPFT